MAKTERQGKGKKNYLGYYNSAARSQEVCLTMLKIVSEKNGPGRGMKDEEANEIKIRSKRKPRSCLQTWRGLGPVEIPLLEACPKPIKFYLPGPKTITFEFRCNEYSLDPCSLVRALSLPCRLVSRSCPVDHERNRSWTFDLRSSSRFRSNYACRP